MTVALHPRTLEEALAYLADDPTIVPVAGCTDLMVSGAGRLNDFSRQELALELARLEEAEPPQGFLLEQDRGRQLG